MTRAVTKRLRVTNATVFDDIYFHNAEELAEAYPYKLLVAGRAQLTPEEGTTRRRFHEHAMIMTTSGHGRIVVQDNEYSTREGTVAWLDTSTRYEHGCHWDANEWGYIWIGVTGYRLDSILDRLKGRSQPIFELNDFDGAKNQLEDIVQTLRNKEPLADAHLSAVIASLIAQLVACRQSLLQGEFGSDRLGNLFQRVRANLARRWSVEDFARICNLSPSQLYRLFNQRVGTSPMNWLRHERINLAKQALIESNQHIAKVALFCGYSDPYHFSREFRRVVGQSPAKFRKAWTRVS